MAKIIFVTGTGTDVGKTVVTRGILRALTRTKHKVIALKPVESGAQTDGKTSWGSDARALALAAGGLSECKTVAYLLTAPVSPHLAARKDGVTIDPERIVALVQKKQRECDILIVEGAGGLLVPIGDTLLYADVLKDLSCEVLLVAANVLGTINTTLLTIEALKARNIPIVGYVLNGSPETDLGNEEAITSFSKVPCLGIFPTCTLDDDALADAAEKYLQLEKLIP